MLIQKKLLEKLIELAGDSAEYLNEKWITVHPHGSDSKGTHVKVEDGETSKEAVERKFGSGDKKELTKSQIEKKIEEVYAEKRKIGKSVDNYNWKTHPEIKKKLDEKDLEIQKLRILQDKSVNDIKTEPVLNLSVKLIEDTGGFSLKTRTINTEIKNPDKAKLKDYKSWLKREALKQNKGFRFHSFSAPIFEDKRV